MDAPHSEPGRSVVVAAQRHDDQPQEYRGREEGSGYPGEEATRPGSPAADGDERRREGDRPDGDRSEGDHDHRMSLGRVGIVFGSVKATSAAATWAPMATFETRTTQAESRKWSAIPAAETAPTGTPTRMSSAIA